LDKGDKIQKKRLDDQFDGMEWRMAVIKKGTKSQMPMEAQQILRHQLQERTWGPLCTPKKKCLFTPGTTPINRGKSSSDGELLS